jgi:uncharacterized protein (TIGR01777 family)
LKDISQKVFLITGGTGFIGKALCKKLSEEGAEIFVLTRTLKESSKKIHYINSLSELVNVKIDIVINLAGETIAQRWSEKAKDKILNSRISVTSDIVQYIENAKHKPNLFISGSAIGYYGNDDTIEFNETTKPKNTESFSHKICKLWEEEALKAQNHVTRLILLRTAVVLEKNGGMLAKLLPSFHLGLGSIVGDGKQHISWIDREDLIRLILFIIENNEITGAINASAPNPVSNKIFSLSLAKALHRPCFLKTPAFVLRLIFGQMADELMLAGQKILPDKALKNGFKFSYPTIELSLNKIFKKTTD